MAKAILTPRVGKDACFFPALGKENAFIESFNGRLRDELLNETLFASLAAARVALADWMPAASRPRLPLRTPPK